MKIYHEAWFEKNLNIIEHHFILKYLNCEKNFDTDPSWRFREKSKNTTLILKNDVTEPKARLL